MAAVIWAADLLTKLEATGTPPAKVLCVRDAMAERWKATAHLPVSDPERHMTAAEAAGLLEARYGAGHGTAKKARAIHETGEYAPPPPAVHPAEEIPPPPKVGKDVEAKLIEKAKADEGKPAPKASKPAAGKPGAKPPAGKKADEKPEPKRDDAPGVVDPAAEVPTVGPKPVEG
jgi:hypothetical protein